MHREWLLPALCLFVNALYSVQTEKCGSRAVSRVYQLEMLRNCTTITGHLTLMHLDFALVDGSMSTFPELTEVEEYVMFYGLENLSSLGKLFPNLSIIGGKKYATNVGGTSLIIARMHQLEEIGLYNLRIGKRSSVAIFDCQKLCYVNTIDWRRLGASKLLDFDHDRLHCKDKLCQNECFGYCWNDYTCQKRKESICMGFSDEGKCVPNCRLNNKFSYYPTKKCWTRKECEDSLPGRRWVFNGTCIDACPESYEHDSKAEGNCRHIANYTKVCSGKVIDSSDELENMAGCEHIKGSLEIRLSDESLNLTNYLGKIKSISGYLKIGRSGISSLDFFQNLTVIKGEKLDNGNYSLFVFENQNLRKLWNFNEDFKLEISAGSVAFHDNPQLCLDEIRKLEKIKGVKNKIDMDIVKSSNGYSSICNQKNLNTSVIENNPTNVTIVWKSEKEVDDNIIGYTVYFQPAEYLELPNDTCDFSTWEGIFVREKRVQLKELTPYTTYKYYIKTYKSDVHQEEQTPEYNFSTAASKPSAPNNVTVTATDSSIILQWEPPKQKNGILTHYNILYLYKEDYLHERNYCDYPHTFEERVEPLLTKNGSCDCVDSEETSTKFELWCTEVSQQDLIFMHSIGRDQVVVNVSSNLNCTDKTYCTYEFRNLKHFSLYIFYIQACNSNDLGGIECGSTVTIAQRTEKRKSADIVRSLGVNVDSKNVRVYWYEPQESNSILVSYQIEYKRVDSEHSKVQFECIKQRENQEGKHEFEVQELSSGSYEIRVQAVSLAGPGVFSQWKKFHIGSNSSSQLITWVLVLVGILAIAVPGGTYYWYNRRKRSGILVRNINPDYAGTYVEDHWEIDRNDIEIGKSIGQGSFGMVYQGIRKSTQEACAVKTTTERASPSSKCEFLNEGSVMKNFSEAHHVIKLIGIVSRDEPPLVVMELMDKGDLKQFLRNCRGSSQNLTTNEIYRMAAEIADGMAYLAAKKYVHRDLAARNCMVAADRTVKIGDFGMARDVYETDYYRKGTVGLLPVRWMSPESLADGVFTCDSDVWSYGVVLWEMATLAQQPYQGLHNEEVFHFVKSKGRLERPNECSDFLYKIMDECWAWRPYERPTFTRIVHQLRDHVGEGFQLVAFVFSRMGLELALHARPRVYNPPAMAVEEGFGFSCDTQEEEEEDDLEEIHDIDDPQENAIRGHYDRRTDEVKLYKNIPNRPFP